MVRFMHILNIINENVFKCSVKQNIASHICELKMKKTNREHVAVVKESDQFCGPNS